MLLFLIAGATAPGEHVVTISAVSYKQRSVAEILQSVVEMDGYAAEMVSGAADGIKSARQLMVFV